MQFIHSYAACDVNMTGSKKLRMMKNNFSAQFPVESTKKTPTTEQFMLQVKT